MSEPVFLQKIRHLFHAASLDERRCSLCHAPFSPVPHDAACADSSSPLPGASLCPSCATLLRPRTTGYCPRCGRLQAIPDAPQSPCGDCLTVPPPWDHFRFYGVYADALKDLLLRGKFGSDPVALNLLGNFLAQVCLDLPRPDAIVPMPLHPSRLRERGFNQCQELAYPVAEALGVPLRPDFLVRCLPTPHQVGLNREERLSNLQKAFVASPAVRGMRILLIDDTCTTGTTLRRATLALLDSHGGAQAVDVAVVARTSSERSNGSNMSFLRQY